MKNEAYKELVILCKRAYPDANRDFVVKKIQSIRGSFRKELKKIEESKKSGTSPDDVYEPSLWYFDLLLFTKDQELSTYSVSNIAETYTETAEELKGSEVALIENKESNTSVEVNLLYIYTVV